MIATLPKKDYFSIVFRIGMWWRIIYGLVKFILGLVLLHYVHNSFADVFYRLVGRELVEDPNDLLITTARHFVDNHTANVTYFIAIYFIFWGALDFFLSINLLELRLWSYPVSLVLISVFTLYEVYRFTHTHSLLLLWIIIIDLFVLWLINKEYKKLIKLNLR